MSALTAPMTDRRRVLLAVAAVLVVEVVAGIAYARRGTGVHYWLHLMNGVTAGAAVWAVVLLRRPWVDRSGAGAITAVAAGHLFAAVPDLLFLWGGVLHVRWMDVFAVHIRIHMVPQALWTSLVLLAVALGAWRLADAGRRRSAAAAVAALVVLTAGALLAAPPIPTSVAEVQALAPDQLWCELAAPSGA